MNELCDTKTAGVCVQHGGAGTHQCDTVAHARTEAARCGEAGRGRGGAEGRGGRGQGGGDG